jgi:hypothetical protein
LRAVDPGANLFHGNDGIEMRNIVLIGRQPLLTAEKERDGVCVRKDLCGRPFDPALSPDGLGRGLAGVKVVALVLHFDVQRHTPTVRQFKDGR